MAPTEPTKLPLGAGRQGEAGAGEYVPSPHCLHSVLPTLSVDEPAGHSRHSVRPVAGWYVLTGQYVQVPLAAGLLVLVPPSASGMYRPASLRGREAGGCKGGRMGCCRGLQPSQTSHTHHEQQHDSLRALTRVRTACSRWARSRRPPGT